MPFGKVSYTTFLRNLGDGELIHFYDQGQDPRLRGLDITSNGWCHGVAIHWIKFKKKEGAGDTSFWDWMQTSRGESACSMQMADQAVRPKLALMLANRALQKGFANLATAQAQYDDDRTNKNRVWLQHAGLAFLGKHTGNASQALLAQAVTGTHGRFARIGLFFTGGGGHAVAAAQDGKSWRFMDPNAGEVALKSAGKFDAFFPKFYAMRYPTWGLASWYVEKYD